jgi:hypothetical protein
VRPVSAIHRIEAHRSKLSRIASDHLPIKAIVDVRRLFGAGAAATVRVQQHQPLTV